jgi:hypothetical protein
VKRVPITPQAVEKGEAGSEISPSQSFKVTVSRDKDTRDEIVFIVTIANPLYGFLEYMA